jgi:hypothetical protein
VLLCGRCPHKSGTCAAFVATVQRAVVVVEVVEVKEPTEFLKEVGGDVAARGYQLISNIQQSTSMRAHTQSVRSVCHLRHTCNSKSLYHKSRRRRWLRHLVCVCVGRDRQ